MFLKFNASTLSVTNNFNGLSCNLQLTTRMEYKCKNQKGAIFNVYLLIRNPIIICSFLFLPRGHNVLELIHMYVRKYPVHCYIEYLVFQHRFSLKTFRCFVTNDTNFASRKLPLRL